MKPACHIGAAVMGGGLILSQGGAWHTALGFASATVLVDFDHVVDHLLFSVEPPTVSNFFRRGNPGYWTRIVFLLHSYELLLAAAVLSFAAGTPLCSAIFWGYAIHLAMDEIGNRLPGFPVWIHPLFYFFTFRLLHGFRPLSFSRAKTGPDREKAGRIAESSL